MMTFTKYLIPACCYILFLQITPARASEFYVGASLGHSNYDEKNKPPVPVIGIRRSPSPTPAPVFIRSSGLAPVLSSNTEDDTAISAKFYAGYNFARHFGVETGYVVLGSSEQRIHATFTDSERIISINTKVEGVQLMLIGKYPIMDSFNIYGKIGGTRWNAVVKNTRQDTSPSLPNSRTTTVSDIGLNLAYGLGAEYRITGLWGVRAEWEQNPGIMDDQNVPSAAYRINSFNLGIYYLFQAF